MDELDKVRIFYKLKSIYRFNSVDKRKESSAEHSWSCLVLADYFLTTYNIDVDRLRVYELLIYHDVVEIEAGGTPLHPDISRKGKEQKEQDAKQELEKVLPKTLGSKFSALFDEYEQQQTKEAQFAKAIDALDAQIHELDYKADWKGWSEAFLIEKKSKYMQAFPELKKAFNQIITYLKDNGYFNQ